MTSEKTTWRRVQFFYSFLFSLALIFVWDTLTSQVIVRARIEEISPVFGLVGWSYAWTIIAVFTAIAVVWDKDEFRTLVSLMWLGISTTRGLAFWFVVGQSGIAVAALWAAFGLSVLTIDGLLGPHRWKH